MNGKFIITFLLVMEVAISISSGERERKKKRAASLLKKISRIANFYVSIGNKQSL